MSSRRIDWESQIGRRLKLRDLHVFFTAVQRGSMAKAAKQLGVSQPAVSEIIADLENALGVRLLDRHPQGIVPTNYGEALIKRSAAVFDELKQSVRDIEFLADPTAGEVKLGCTEAMAAILSPVMESFTRQYPGVLLRTFLVTRPFDLPGLRGRNLDFTLGHLVRGPGDRLIDDLNVEALFDDRLVVATGISSPWAARRRRIDLAELVDEAWILAEAPDSWNYSVMADAFRARGLRMPKISVMTFSVHLRMGMLASGHFITTFPNAILRFHPDRRSIKVLPVDLPDRPCPVVIVTLKNRMLNPVVERLIAHIRDFTSPMRTYETRDRAIK
jgi:DNA-binding transcriptional LysR family regulator